MLASKVSYAFLLSAAVFVVVGLAVCYMISRDIGDYFLLITAVAFGFIVSIAVLKILNAHFLVRLVIGGIAVYLFAKVYWGYVVFLRRDVFQLMHPKDVGLAYGLYEYAVMWHSVIWVIFFLVLNLIIDRR